MTETSNLTDMKDSLQKALHQVILVRFLQTFTGSQNKNSTVLLMCYVLVGATVTLIVTGAERDVQASAQQREHTTGLTFTALLSPLQSVTFSSSSSSSFIFLYVPSSSPFLWLFTHTER